MPTRTVVRVFVCVVFGALAGCGSEAPDDEVSPVSGPTIPRVVSAQEALGTSEIPTLDPHTMNDAEISKVLGEGPFCAFRYVSDGKPVLAWKRQPAEGTATAVVKLNGVLVKLQSNASASATQFVSDELRLTMTPSESNKRDRSETEHPQEAKLLFEVGQRLRWDMAATLSALHRPAQPRQ